MDNKDKYIEEDKDGEMYFEISCRGLNKCGSFVSSTEIDYCPKCRSDKVLLRMIKKKIEPSK